MKAMPLRRPHIEPLQTNLHSKPRSAPTPTLPRTKPRFRLRTALWHFRNGAAVAGERSALLSSDRVEDTAHCRLRGG